MRFLFKSSNERVKSNDLKKPSSDMNCFIVYSKLFPDMSNRK